MAGVSMLGLHCTADPTGQPWVAYPPEDRLFPMLLRAVLYTARTELFLIIAIFLLLLALERRPRSYRTTMAEQMRRLLVPFVFWTVFYAAYGLIKADAFGYLASELNRLGNPGSWVDFFLLGKVKYHMHFLPTLFGLVIMYPLFRCAVRRPILGLGVVVGLILKRELDGYVFATYWGDDVLPYLVRGVKILTYVGYGMVAGAALGLYRTLSPYQLSRLFFPLLGLGAVLFIIKLSATHITVQRGAWPFDYLPGYWADFLMPAVLFVLCMALGHKRWPTVISRLAPYSFGIYLCHPIFLDLCEIWLRDTHLKPMAQVVIKITATAFCTTGLVLLLGRTRSLAWTIGLGPIPRLRLFAPVQEPAQEEVSQR